LINVVELELLKIVRIYLVVNVSQIWRYKKQVRKQKKTLLPLVIIERKKEYKVKRILNKRRQ